jgi:hypothetical protein
MKKSVTGVLALLAGASIAHAQGIVAFNNYGSPAANYTIVSYTSSGNVNTPLGGSDQGSPAPTMNNYASEVGYGDDWTVELYGGLGWNLASGSLTPATDGPAGTGNPIQATFANSGEGYAGQWNSTAYAAINGSTLDNQNVTLKVYAWYNDGGTITSYAQALADGVPTGFSATINATTGGPQTVGSPIPAPLAGSFGTFDVAAVPEPSTIALGVLGASAFLMRLRRKN